MCPYGYRKRDLLRKLRAKMHRNPNEPPSNTRAGERVAGKRAGVVHSTPSHKPHHTSLLCVYTKPLLQR
eukprot:jgi/Chlat1/2229/Chrsp17S02780